MEIEIMAAIGQPVSDMMVTVKSREVQRGMLAEMRKDRAEAARHFLAAAHLELVLASDYAQAGEEELACRSRISAASCLWRAGRTAEAREQFDAIRRDFPARATAVGQAVLDLEKEPEATPLPG
jgi:hypothetical protein